jgi:hypothetical protein
MVKLAPFGPTTYKEDKVFDWALPSAPFGPTTYKEDKVFDWALPSDPKGGSIKLPLP